MSSVSSRKSRHSRLSDRIQRTRRNRQWANANAATPAATTPTASTSSPASSSPTSDSSSTKSKDEARRKIERAAASYQRHRRARTSPTTTKSEFFPATSKMIGSPLVSPKPSPRASPKASPSKIPPPKAVYSNKNEVNNDTTVASVEDESHDIVDNVEMTLSETEELRDSPASKSSKEEPEVEEEKVEEEKADDPTKEIVPTPAAPTPAENLPKSNDPPTTDQEKAITMEDSSSVSSLKPTTQQPRRTVAKRYAPWEKQPEEEEQQDREPVKPRIMTRKVAPWKKPQTSEESSSDDASKAQIDKEKEEETNSSENSERPQTTSVQSRFPPTNRKPAPWQKSQISLSSNNNRTTISKPQTDKEQEDELNSVKNSEIPATNTVHPGFSTTSRKAPGKLAPWQKPTQESQLPGDDSSSRKSSSDLETTKTAPSSSQEEDEDKNLAPWQREMKLRKSRNASSVTTAAKPETEQDTITKDKEEQTPSDEPDKSEVATRPTTSRRGKVQTPAWMRPSSQSQQGATVAGSYQRNATQPSWKKNQQVDSTAISTQEPSEGEEKKQEVEHDTKAHAIQEESSASGSHLKSTIGGRAVIETPKVMSVASLRANLGSKPNAPPLPGTKPAGLAESPWRLAGNRKAGNRVGSPYTHGSRSAQQDSPAKSNDHSMRETTGSIEYSPSDEGRSNSMRKNPVSKQVGQKEATPKVSHMSSNNNEVEESPIKSLADLAADSVVVMDYSQLTVRNPDDLAKEDAESMVSVGEQGQTTPIRSDLPSEFQNILGEDENEVDEDTTNAVLAYGVGDDADKEADHSNRDQPLSAEALRRHTQSEDRKLATIAPVEINNRPISVRERMQALERQQRKENSSAQNDDSTRQVRRSNRSGTSRILKFYGANEQNKLSENEEHQWAGKDPEDDVTSDRSPSPEPSTRIQLTGSQKENRFMDNFSPDPNDPFYNLSATTAKPNEDEAAAKFLKPDDVFDSFWGTDMAASNKNITNNETIDFADDSFFADNKLDTTASQESPFRVLKPPRQSPATSRVRRQREASNDFGKGVKYSQPSTSWSG